MMKKWLGTVVRQVRLLMVLAIFTVVGGTAWSYLMDISDPEQGVASVDTAGPEAEAIQGWGDEFVAGVHEHVMAGLPIQVANACGLGASSCFRCHNGQRAPAPSLDAEKNPWHVQHQSVNNSCGGCHQGNPRLMKQSIAHKGMIADPRQEPATSCFSCHTSADAQGMVDIYLKLTNNPGE